MRDDCPFAGELKRVLRVIDGNGQEGLVKTVTSLSEWREREEKRGAGNRKLLWAIFLVLLPIAGSRLFDYISPRQQQAMTTSGQSVTTHTDSNGNDSYSTTNTKSTSSGVKK